MYGPYGKNASMYYKHAAFPRAYDYDWRGVPIGGNRAATTRGLGAGPKWDLGGMLDLDIKAKYEGELSGLGNINPGKSWPVSMSAESGRRSLLHSGPEQTHLFDAPKAVGAFQLSDNEKRLAQIAAVGGAVYFLFFRKGKKGKKR